MVTKSCSLIPNKHQITLSLKCPHCASHLLGLYTITASRYLFKRPTQQLIFRVFSLQAGQQMAFQTQRWQTNHCAFPLDCNSWRQRETFILGQSTEVWWLGCHCSCDNKWCHSVTPQAASLSPSHFHHSCLQSKHLVFAPAILKFSYHLHCLPQSGYFLIFWVSL